MNVQGLSLQLWSWSTPLLWELNHSAWCVNNQKTNQKHSKAPVFLGGQTCNVTRLFFKIYIVYQ